MGNCIICDTPVDGEICKSHEEDVVFEFRGDSAEQLTPGRYYRGSVDGYADFGVFVDIGRHVTGLLHRSELDRRLESLNWEPGDTIYVQVLDVRDNGNVDLGWSIRQDESEFRGKLIQTADGEYLPETIEDESTETTDDSAGTVDKEARGAAAEQSNDRATNGGNGPTSVSSEPAHRDAVDSSVTDDAVDQVAEEAVEESTRTSDLSTSESALNRTTVDAISAQVGSVVRLEGEITGVRQTSGPTIFEFRDETGTVECAAFEEAGVRAYPAADVGDIVRLDGEVERHHGDLQIETETLDVLDGDDRGAVVERLEEAIRTEAQPAQIEPFVEDDVVSAVIDEIGDAATTIRRAVIEARPIVVRHSATADGYVAGAAIERAVLPLIREKHTRENAEYNYFERRPLDGSVYGMDAATADVTDMLEAQDRHGEQLPLVILVDAGSTADSVPGYEYHDIYGATTLVIDDQRADESISEFVDVSVVPSLAGIETESADLTSTVLAATVAAHVNEAVSGDLEHLPAISFWGETPTAYRELAREAGYDETAILERREAVALEAYYHSYKDKRELISDLLFDDGDIASHVSEQYRAKIETELEVALANLERWTIGGAAIDVLDTDAFVHRYDFPTIELLVEEVHRRRSDEESGPVYTIGIGDGELRVRGTTPIDAKELGSAIERAVPEAGIRVVGGSDGHVEFLVGERESVLEAALEAVGGESE